MRTPVVVVVVIETVNSVRKRSMLHARRPTRARRGDTSDAMWPMQTYTRSAAATPCAFCYAVWYRWRKNKDPMQHTHPLPPPPPCPPFTHSLDASVMFRQKCYPLLHSYMRPAS